MCEGHHIDHEIFSTEIDSGAVPEPVRHIGQRFGIRYIGELMVWMMDDALFRQQHAAPLSSALRKMGVRGALPVEHWRPAYWQESAFRANLERRISEVQPTRVHFLHGHGQYYVGEALRFYGKCLTRRREIKFGSVLNMHLGILVPKDWVAPLHPKEEVRAAEERHRLAQENGRRTARIKREQRLARTA